MSKRVLLIAPDLPGLETSIEAELIGGRYFNITPLQGEVDHERITRATARSRFDILHFASHGGNDGILLSGNRTLTKEHLAQIANQTGAELVYLNACNSALLGQFLADRGVPLVIANTKETLDDDAIRTAAYFYASAADYDGDYRKANERVSPKDGSLAIFAGSGYIDRLIQPLMNAISEMAKKLDALRKQMMAGQRTTMQILAGSVGALLLISAAAIYIIASVSNARAEAEIDRFVDAMRQVAPTEVHEILQAEVFMPLGLTEEPEPTQPGCGPSGGQPKKCDTPTPVPTPATEDLTPTPETTRTKGGTIPVPTDEPELTPVPTLPPETATFTPEATATVAPSETATRLLEPTATVTEEDRPTSTPVPPTWTPTRARTPVPDDVQMLIDASVNATLTAIVPSMCEQVCR